MKEEREEGSRRMSTAKGATQRLLVQGEESTQVRVCDATTPMCVCVDNAVLGGGNASKVETLLSQSVEMNVSAADAAALPVVVHAAPCHHDSHDVH